MRPILLHKYDRKYRTEWFSISGDTVENRYEKIGYYWDENPPSKSFQDEGYLTAPHCKDENAWVNELKEFLTLVEGLRSRKTEEYNFFVKSCRW